MMADEQGVRDEPDEQVVRDLRYAELKAHDPRFDGRFFVGVTSTGIYCRPVCKAKLPAKRNCRFFKTAAEAEQAGFRPCLLCRPDIAPGLSPMEAGADLARRSAQMLQDECASIGGLDSVAARLGYTTRHLRRVFEEAYQVTPLQFLQTCRLLLAKSLLTDSDLTVGAVARAAGFGSTRRFNQLFKEHYRLCPTKLRKQTAGITAEDGLITLQLSYRPPYAWGALLDFFAGRAIAGVELVRDGAYFCTVRLADKQGKPVCGWLRVRNLASKNRLAVSISESLLPVVSTVLARIRRQFDLGSDPAQVAEQLQVMDELRPGLCVAGTRVPGCFDAFQMCVRTVLGQQITVKAAGTLAARIAETYGTPIETGVEGLDRLFPSAGEVLTMGDAIEDNFGRLGVTSARSRTIRALAEAVSTGEVDFAHPADPTLEMDKLCALKGIGPWSANYIAMRAMGYGDAFLESDYGVKKALPGYGTPKARKALAEAWHPWRSYAVMNLWNSL
ncbi:MAG: helix-turn-helix domain-containing protein [Coriobacteriales bacterium]|jgi:AraC family transcriptional regulator of adaptative response / DNA-3-methyladenine glycosylase II|nr:helix-turn-helix domain-containing protein [Coriobacteriales bacterium]